MKTLCSHTKLPEKPETGPTVEDIFKKYGPSFRSAHRLHPRQHKVMYDIEHSRRDEFGTHWELCDTCGHLEKGYNSCRNRHCPGCNNIARRRWVSARIGFYGILHTWGGRLWLPPPHPFHCYCRRDKYPGKVETDTIAVLAKRQPVAGDLRYIICVIKNASEFERIADYAVNIAKRVLLLDGTPFTLSTRYVTDISRDCRTMINNVLDAFDHLDELAAVAVWQKDDDVDMTNPPERKKIYL